MPKAIGFDEIDASVSVFVVKEVTHDSMWSLHPIITGTPGDATYTIMCSNKDRASVEADFRDYRPSTATDVAINLNIDSINFPFRYRAIKYTAGTATGTLSIYTDNKEDK